jgi:hypothetical protein
MSNINNFANDLLLDFLDSFHKQVKLVLEGEFGSEWLEKGVEKHLAKGYFDRTRDMLESPMRVVDMDKADDELYGVEHLWNIINGNWKVFDPLLGERNRTEVYLGEIAEVRHNVSHRRPHHYLRIRDVARLAENCSMLLRALGSTDADYFSSISERVTSGDPPWAQPLGGRLPPEDEIVSYYVERSVQRALHEWFTQDSRQLVVWGDGGAGKSAATYRFAREIKEAAPDAFSAVCWVTAKRLEFVEGAPRDKAPDFDDIPSFCRALLTAIYDTETPDEDVSMERLLKELSEVPCVVVIDDIDTVLNDDQLANFLLFELRTTKSKFIYTSRSRIPGLTTIDIGGFTDDELLRFLRSRVAVYDLHKDTLEKRAPAIASVTNSYPLFVDDLLRYASMVGIDDAVGDWSQRKGDAAREYALRRQMESLRSAARDAILSIAVADRPLTLIEIATVAGRTDDDVQLAAEDLLKWKLITRVAVDGDRPSYTMNNNTRRLVQKTYGKQPEWLRFQEAFRAQSGLPTPAAMRQAIGGAISLASSYVVRGDEVTALQVLKDGMTGELAHNADMHGALGWLYTRSAVLDRDAARKEFKDAHSLGAKKEDTYFHWSQMERDFAWEVSPNDSREGLRAWQRCYEAAELGIERIGPTQQLCYLAGLARFRAGKLFETFGEYARARGLFGHALASFRQSIDAPPSASRDVSLGLRLKSVVMVLEGMEDVTQLRVALKDWEEQRPNDPDLAFERERLTWKFRDL